MLESESAQQFKVIDNMSTGEINQSNAGMGGGDAGGDWPKASIGNYKGVMLCNRPNEFGQ